MATRLFGALLVAVATVAVSASATPVRFTGKLAFVRYSDGIGQPQLFVLRTSGARAERLKLGVFAVDVPAWSPDGRTLVVVGGRNHPGEPRVTEADDLYLVRADGGGLRRLTRDAAHESGVTWSPDGKRIAYVRSSAAEPNRTSIVVRPVRGGAVRRLTFGNVDLEPSWSPDGTWIVFLRIDARTRASGIWLVRPDGSGLHRILRRLPNVTDPVWSPRGDRLVVSDGARLLVVAPDGSQRRVLTLLAADAKGGRVDPEPAWSPDGNEVVFVQVRRGGVFRSDLWLVHADGTARSRLTRSTGLDFAPSWGP